MTTLESLVPKLRAVWDARGPRAALEQIASFYDDHARDDPTLAAALLGFAREAIGQLVAQDPAFRLGPALPADADALLDSAMEKRLPPLMVSLRHEEELIEDQMTAIGSIETLLRQSPALQPCQVFVESGLLFESMQEEATREPDPETPTDLQTPEVPSFLQRPPSAFATVVSPAFQGMVAGDRHSMVLRVLADLPAHVRARIVSVGCIAPSEARA